MKEKELGNYENYESYDEFEGEEKKKHKFLKGFLIFLTIIGILVGAFFWCFYVNDKTEVATRDDVDTQTIYYDALSKSVDDIAESKKMKFSFEQIIANSLIKSTLDNAEDELKKNITGGYFLLKDETTIVIGIKLKFGFFLSRIQMICKYEKFDGGSDDNSGIKLTIEEIKLGRVPGFANLFASISGALKLDKLVEDALKGMELAVKVNLKEKQIIYTYSAFRSDLQRIIDDRQDEEGSTKLEIYEDFLGRFLSNDYVDTGIRDESVFVNIDCTSLTEGVLEDKKIVYDLGELKNMMNVLLPKNEKLKVQKNYLQYLNYFYVHGYNNLTDKYKAYVDEYFDFEDYLENFPSSNYKNYAGITSLYTDKKFDAAVRDQLNVTNLASKVANHQTIVDITDKNISAMIRQNSTILGYASILERVENDKLIYNFMMLDDFYCQINENETTFYVSVSLNGLDLNLKLVTKPRQGEGEDKQKLFFDVDKIYLGSNEIEYSAINDIMKILITSTKEDEIAIIEEEEKVSILLDFKQLKNNTTIGNRDLKIDIGSTQDHIKISC